MKRCPQCEFVYEDDQSLCDMDGILLVFDSQKLPKPKASTTPQWRSRGVTVGASAVLAIVLSLVYYVSTHQRATTPVNNTRPPVVNAAQPISSESPVVSSGSDGATEVKEKEKSEAKSAPEVKTKERPEVKAVPTSNAASRQLKEKPKTKSPEKVSGSQPTSQNDSKLGSLLKKTGNVLKKPFKF